MVRLGMNPEVVLREAVLRDAELRDGRWSDTLIYGLLIGDHPDRE